MSVVEFHQFCRHNLPWSSCAVLAGGCYPAYVRNRVNTDTDGDLDCHKHIYPDTNENIHTELYGNVYINCSERDALLYKNLYTY
jgi:hypothetical protein